MTQTLESTTANTGITVISERETYVSYTHEKANPHSWEVSETNPYSKAKKSNGLYDSLFFLNVPRIRLFDNKTDTRKCMIFDCEKTEEGKIKYDDDGKIVLHDKKMINVSINLNNSAVQEFFKQCDIAIRESVKNTLLKDQTNVDDDILKMHQTPLFKESSKEEYDPTVQATFFKGSTMVNGEWTDKRVGYIKGEMDDDIAKVHRNDVYLTVSVTKVWYKKNVDLTLPPEMNTRGYPQKSFGGNVIIHSATVWPNNKSIMDIVLDNGDEENEPSGEGDDSRDEENGESGKRKRENSDDNIITVDTSAKKQKS